VLSGIAPNQHGPATDGVVLTYDPQDQTLRADGHDPRSVTIGKDH
jgi:hypothetical protein